MAKKNSKKKKQVIKVDTKPKADREEASVGSYLRNHKSIFIIFGMLFVMLGMVVYAFCYVIANYTITEVYVDGNVHYTNEEITNMVMEGYYGNNSLLLSLKYKDKSITNVPFIEKIDVSIVNPNSVRIEVYEKTLAGCIEYLEKYMYFDKDGIVVESSDERTSGVPVVTGLKFDHVIMHEPLPVEDSGIFNSILNITQLLAKYNLSASRIYFGSDDTLTLYFGGVRAALGTQEYLDEKIMRLQDIIPELEGKRGVLKMESFTEDTKNISFEPDKEAEEES